MSQQVAQSDVYDMETETPGWVPMKVVCSAWGLSLIVHALALGAMGLIYFDVPGAVTTVIDSAFDDVNPEQYKFDSTTADQIGSGSNVNALSASQEAATAVGKDPQEEAEKILDENFEIKAPMNNEVVEVSKADMLAPVQTTGGTEHTGGVEGSIDRMAFEIASQLREKKTLVVWVFDVSPSLSKRREVIAERVENIYGQLNSLNVTADKALKTAVAVFGEKATIVTPEPLDEVEDVVKAVRGIKSEESGKENVFAAVSLVANRFLTQRTKNNRAVMIIVVTDEAGSDAEQNLESTIQLTKRYGMKTYVIGEAAPLGRRQVEAEFTLETGETVIGVMDRGPESFYQDRLGLGYWGVGGYDLENISSGFGPYALTRLCAETNGLFLVSNTDNRFNIDPTVMRGYSPDYRPIPILMKDIQSNLAKRAVVELCEEFKGVRIPIPTDRFPAENDNVLRTNIGDAQKPLAELDYRLDAILRKLEAGEKDRAKLTEPRWRAIYDLTMGRVLAMRVRSFGYNMMLAEMKASPKKFEKQGSNLWTLKPSKEVTSGAASKKMSNKAQEYLKRVIDEHTGTPWAILAEREFSTPLGWEWKEGNYNPNAQNMGNGKDKKAPRFVEEIDPKTGKKTKRQLPDQPVRRDI